VPLIARARVTRFTSTRSICKGSATTWHRSRKHQAARRCSANRSPEVIPWFDDLGQAQQRGWRPASPERELLPGQIGGAVGGARDLVDVGDLLRILERRAQDAAVPADDEQDVVEVVSDAASKLADRFHLL
jgi:hypothetical protein